MSVANIKYLTRLSFARQKSVRAVELPSHTFSFGKTDAGHYFSQVISFTKKNI